MCKYSVVVKGIERKLKELGCKVSIVTQENEKIPKIDEDRERQLGHGMFLEQPDIRERIKRMEWTVLDFLKSEA